MKKMLKKMFLAISVIVLGVKAVAGVPAAPTWLRELTGTTDSNISIRWDIPSETVDNYNIYLVTGSEEEGNLTYSLIEQIEGPAIMYNVTVVPAADGGTEPLKPYTNYRFSVSALNIDGESNKSNIVSITTLHTWHGKLKECLNQITHHDVEHVPDRQDVESVTEFSCIGLNAFENDTIDEIRDLVYVRNLDLSNTFIYLPIPSWITELDHLSQLTLTDYFSGTIPENIGDALPNMISLKIASRYVTGSVPASIGNMHDLESLNLSYCQLEGSLPSSIASLGQLKTLKVSFAAASGELPNMSGLTELTDLEVVGKFHIFPKGVEKLTKLKSLKLEGLQLDSTIPSQIKEMTSLETLTLKNSHITGPIPQWIGNFYNLKNLVLGGNALFGEVPKSILNLTNLERLNLKYNCNLYTDDPDIQDFIKWHCSDPDPELGCIYTDYELELINTNTFKCDMGLSAVRYLLLN